nr:Uma2 family endonuclease [Coleofasciculus sp. FACHB-T130]
MRKSSGAIAFSSATIKLNQCEGEKMTLTAQQLDAMMPDASQLYSDEPEMESSLHYMQLLLLVTCLEWLWREREDFFIGANLTIYFSRQQLRNRDFRGPDFFLVKQTQKHPRNAWVVWEEDGKYPNLIIELLSTSTATTDRSLKKDLYQDRFRTPEYFWFSPDTLEFQGFRLMGNQYQEIAPNEKGWRWSEELGLYLGVEQGQLRYFTPEGDRVPTPEEAAQQAQVQAQQAQAQAQQAQSQLEQERQRAERLAERLRSLGIDPE